GTNSLQKSNWGVAVTIPAGNVPESGCLFLLMDQEVASPFHFGRQLDRKSRLSEWNGILDWHRPQSCQRFRKPRIGD
ncbi:MAG: hypothetical protein AB1846_16230, partial [Chloroflexota bacterium]